MKKILILLCFLGLSNTIIAQLETPYSIGYISGYQKAVQTATPPKQDFIYFNGDPLASRRFATIDGVGDALCGVPYGVSFFPRVLDKHITVSKGYFSEYVILQWNIIASQDRISRIQIYRKQLGTTGDSILVGNIPGEQNSFRDEFAEKGTLYKYTIFLQGIADGMKIPLINHSEGIGFSFPFGTASGRITFAGGSAVEGVVVSAETDGNLKGKSLTFNGVNQLVRVEHNTSDTELELRDGFTLQTWVKRDSKNSGTIFQKGIDYQLTYSSTGISFRVSNKTIFLPFVAHVDTFFHVTAVYKVDSMFLYINVNENKSISIADVAGTQPAAAETGIVFATNQARTDYFKGVIDEIRLFRRALPKSEILNYYDKYIGGNEADMIGYWRLNEGNGNEMYDFSRKSTTFNNNNGTLVGKPIWSEITPLRTQLSYKGITDSNGNYVVTGFPYSNAGSQYTFTPMYGVHQFDPAQVVRYIGDGAAIQNSVNFTDVSSFKVTGTVKYEDSFFPVEGVSILIDGKAAITGSGSLILSDNLGRFSVDVPIGLHSIQLQKNLHQFKDEGRFPKPIVTTVPGFVKLYNFVKDENGLEMIDITRVKWVGKVVGGPVEAAKKLGFGKSVNNIGNATISMTTQKGYDLATTTVAGGRIETYAGRNFGSRVAFITKNVTVNPDPVSGEFIAMLPPEKYTITNVSAGSYTFGSEANITVDLQQFIKQNENLADTLGKIIRNVTVAGYPPINPSKYLRIRNVRRGDTTFIMGYDSLFYDARNDFILRNVPTISVLTKNDDELFGEINYTYSDKVRNISQVIPLLNTSTGVYSLGYPVFEQRKKYDFNIQLFEQYINANTAITYNVPVVDGRIEVVNNLAVNTDLQTIELDKNGKAKYSFNAGLPNTAKNANFPELSYTKTMNVVAVSGQGGNIRTTWRSADPFKGIIFGGMPVGNNFVTTGPKDIIAILRDPPGSNSKTTLEKGTTISSGTSWEAKNTMAQETELKVKLGVEVKIFAGVGAGTITETEYQNNVNVGFQAEETWTKSGETQTSITTTQSWSTSSEPNFVGRDGDVFIGYGTNIVYGRSDNLEMIPASECVSCDGPTVLGYALGLKVGIRMTPKFGTAFTFTQSHIEKTLMPDLIRLRDLNLIVANPASINPATITQPVYVSKLPRTDPKFGSSNYDKELWGALATTVNGMAGDGPSYKVIIPSSWPAGKQVPDTVFYYNRSLSEWKSLLAENEEQKVKATLEKNISFDNGSIYTSSSTTEKTESTSRSFDFFVSPSLGGETGGDFNGFGLEFSLKKTYTRAEASGSSSAETKATTFSYEIADVTGAQATDGRANEYLSVDVKKPKDGFSPSFLVRGGASSCPYQGNDTTKYFEPKRHILNNATLKIEKPDMQVRQSTMANVPANRAAEFVVDLFNNSESNEDLAYTLSIEDESNPFGALIELDGSAIGNGRTINVPAGKSIQKILKVKKGLSSQMNYENLQINFGSECDPTAEVSKLISAYFIPGCSDISIQMPKDKWVLNTNITPKDTLVVKMDNYDMNFVNFKSISFQYKPSSSSLWITDKTFYNPNIVTSGEYSTLTGIKGWIEPGFTQHLFDMRNLPDRNYDIRAKANCEVGPGVRYETPTEIISGLKDVKRPRLFGSPQPADGILSNGDEISIKFDEPIEASLLTSFNFSMKGILNSQEIDHYTSLNYDGINDYSVVPDGLDLNNKSFTIEFWLRRNELGRKQVVYSKGTSANDAFEIGFDANDKLYVKSATQTFTSALAYTSSLWAHYGVTFNNTTKKLNAFMNDKVALENEAATAVFNGSGSINIGKSVYAETNYLNGNVHDLRIWNDVKSGDNIYANMYASLNGSEVNLAGYWPMNEADGTKALDKANSRHATLFNDWLVEPKGKSYQFDGTSDRLTLKTDASVTISNEMDYTIEFWFNSAANQTNAVMFGSGKADGTDIFNKKENSLVIGFNENGKIYVMNNNYVLLQTNDVMYNDNNWHHVALTVNRNANAVLVVNGREVAAAPSTNFGGLAGVNMYLGARGYKTSTLATSYDKYFNGKIDEVRIWKMSKKINQILLDKNAKLTGTEIGLVAYYPFENYVESSGIKISEPTIFDQWINRLPNSVNAGSLSISGANPTYSNDAPNIKDARPLRNVDFDFVVNNDMIIFTPATSMLDDIEKTTLEITVDRVEDKNENRLASAISWSAYIDRNQLKWGEVKISKSKKLYAPMTFTVEIKNNGGTQQNYTIENIPAWLRVSPASGTLAPRASSILTFTVFEGQNVGYYSQDLYLSGNFRFKEKLPFDLRVYEQEPIWTVDKTKFQYSMNVIGTIKINGILSTDSYDKIGVFVNGECRGVARPVYFEKLDKYLVFLDIYSNNEFGDSLKFQVFNAQKGVVYDDVLPEMTFETNALSGTISMPTEFTTDDSFLRTLNFSSGWNWVSINLNSPNNSSVAKFFKKLSPSVGDLIKSKTDFDQFNDGLGWLGSLSMKGGLKPGEMYMVKTQNPHNFVYKGSRVAPADVVITLTGGWNWIGYVPDLNYTLEEIFASINPSDGDVVKSQNAFAVYDTRLGWIGTLQYLSQGRGYLYRSAKTATLTYPSFGGSSSRTEAEEKPVYWKVNYANYPTNMSVVVSVAGIAPNEASSLGVFDTQTVCGATYMNNSNLYFLTINTKEDTENKLTFKYENGSGDIYEAHEQLSFSQNEIVGSPSNPYILHLRLAELTSANQKLADSFNATIYPIPSKKGVNWNLKVSGTIAQYITLSVYNSLGVLVKSEKVKSFGISNISTESLPSGIYNVIVSDGIKVKNIKTIVE